jgi:hypothetical protein
LNCNLRNFKRNEVRYEHAKSVQQNVRFECQTISENIQKLKQEEFKDIQVLLYKCKDIQGLEFLFSNSRTFKDFQVLYEPCFSPDCYFLRGVRGQIRKLSLTKDFVDENFKCDFYIFI